MNISLPFTKIQITGKPAERDIFQSVKRYLQGVVRIRNY